MEGERVNDTDARHARRDCGWALVYPPLAETPKYAVWASGSRRVPILTILDLHEEASTATEKLYNSFYRENTKHKKRHLASNFQPTRQTDHEGATNRVVYQGRFIDIRRFPGAPSPPPPLPYPVIFRICFRHDAQNGSFKRPYGIPSYFSIMYRAQAWLYEIRKST